MQDMFREMLETNFKFYKNMDNNPDFVERLTKVLFEDTGMHWAHLKNYTSLKGKS